MLARIVHLTNVPTLVVGITKDPAMQAFLDLVLRRFRRRAFVFAR